MNVLLLLLALDPREYEDEYEDAYEYAHDYEDDHVHAHDYEDEGCVRGRTL